MTWKKFAPLALPVCMVLSLAGCNKPEAAKTAVDTGPIADKVKADADQLVVELNQKDLDKAVAHDAPNMVGMFHGQPNVNGPDEDRAATKAALADPAFHLALSNETVEVSQAGDIAIHRATYAATQTDPKTGQPTTETGNWVAIYKLMPDGTWKIATSIISNTPPPTATAAATAAAPAAATEAAPAAPPTK